MRQQVFVFHESTGVTTSMTVVQGKMSSDVKVSFLTGLFFICLCERESNIDNRFEKVVHLG